MFARYSSQTIKKKERENEGKKKKSPQAPTFVTSTTLATQFAGGRKKREMHMMNRNNTIPEAMGAVL